MPAWIYFTYVYVVLFILLFLVLTVIVVIGGYVDLKYLFKSLKEEIVDEADDGRITDSSLSEDTLTES